MGILDDAIREHLELKRQHGAEEDEIEGLEAEAFGPADRPDAIEPATEIISPDTGVSSADDLDLSVEEETASVGGESDFPEAEAAPAAEPQPETTGEATEPAAGAETTDVDLPDETEAEPVEELDEDYATDLEMEGDAGDLLEAERHHLASHPTEHYDVDAAIAEEDEIDLLSESLLSDELDRALGEPAAPVEPTAEPAPERPPAPAEPEPTIEPEGSEEPEEPGESESEFPSNFFDQDDPLEGTPDFLEETPEHDRLWFEQKEPKDFDFGD